MEKESIGERGMGVRYKGSQGQTKRTVELQEEEDMCCSCLAVKWSRNTMSQKIK
jgi:hypothetical protein